MWRLLFSVSLFHSLIKQIHQNWTLFPIGSWLQTKMHSTKILNFNSNEHCLNNSFDNSYNRMIKWKKLNNLCLLLQRKHKKIKKFLMFVVRWKFLDFNKTQKLNSLGHETIIGWIVVIHLQRKNYLFIVCQKCLCIFHVFLFLFYSIAFNRIHHNMKCDILLFCLFNFMLLPCLWQTITQ